MSQPDIRIESGVSARTGEPFVTIRWGEMGGQLTTAEARDHAMGIIAASYAAETDVAFLEMLRLKPGTQEAAVALAAFRIARGARSDAAAVSLAPTEAAENVYEELDGGESRGG